MSSGAGTVRVPPTADTLAGPSARSTAHRCIRSGRGALGASWSRWASALARASARRSARAGSVGRPLRSGGRSTGPATLPARRRPPGAARRRRPDAARLADERHPLALDGVQAHPQRRRLLRRDLANVGGLLVRGHRSAADDALGLADHEPGQVVAIHAPPRRREQVVRALEPDLERAQRRIGLEPLPFGHELAGRR